MIVGNYQKFTEELLRNTSRDFFDCIIVDEAHHAGCMSYKRLLEHFSSAKVMLLSASFARPSDDAHVGRHSLSC